MNKTILFVIGNFGAYGQERRDNKNNIEEQNGTMSKMMKYLRS